MDRKSIAILLVASSFTSSVFAATFMEKLIPKSSRATSAITKTHKTTNQAKRSYTDFSGTWLMNCDGAPAMTTVIENDAYYITLDGQEYGIGPGLHGETESNQRYVELNHNSFEWNANGSELILKSVHVYKNNMDNSTLETDMDLVTLTMKKGQIIVDGKFVMVEDVTSTEPMAMHCVLTKKQ